MSLTSYRAAPPRGGDDVCVVWGMLEDLAATYSPASWDAVPWALGVFTAEFGMGSGAVSPPKPPGRPTHPQVSACRNLAETASIGGFARRRVWPGGEWGSGSGDLRHG